MVLTRSSSTLGGPSTLAGPSTLIAINRDKTTGQALVKWAVDNLLRGNKKSQFFIIHVNDHGSSSNSNSNSNSQTQSYSFRGNHHQSLTPTSVEEEMEQIFLPCLGYCARKGVTAKELIIHDIDVPSTIIDYILENEMSNVVVGASHRNAFTRKFKEADVATRLLKSAPDFCSVYVISKGKPQTVKAATRRLEHENTSKQQQHSKSSGTKSWTNSSSLTSVLDSQTSHVSTATDNSDNFSLISSFQSAYSNTISDSFSSSSVSDNPFLVQSPDELEAEVSELKLKLNNTMDIYNSICDKAKAAQEKNQANEIGMEEAEEAVAEMERNKIRVASEAADIAERVAEIEMRKKMLSEAEYRMYNIQDIESATDHFNENRKIGEGGYGPVFRGVLDHIPVAIKILRPDISQGFLQFQKEVEVLSSLRHPHMVMLVGACPEGGCLVYEYMENGSLEDRLFRKGDTPPVPWRARFRIAAEIATALLFLHRREPEPLVHRDLKPANILLDRDFVSKIGDVGLARLVPANGPGSAGATQYHHTEAAGTFCYIDPEYQQTGLLGVKSDVYSLGVVLLQILTSRPPIGLSFHVEEAIEEGLLGAVLDPLVPDWPAEPSLALAKLGLRCCEMQRKDRPDLGSDVLPELNRLRDLAMRTDYPSHT